MCAATCNNDENQHHQTADRGHALAGYGVPNGGAGDALVGGRIWATKALTYGFPGEAAAYDQNLSLEGVQYGDGEPVNGFAPLNGAQMLAAEAALAQIASVSLLGFTRNDDAAVISIAQSALPASAYAYFPNKAAEGGDVWLGSSRGYYDDPARGDYAWHAFLHELGHAVGLKHGHDHGVIGAGGPLEAQRDTMEWSVMTYRSYVGDPMEDGYSNENAGYAQSLMRADISALQQLYGANYDHQSGDTHYAWDPETGELLVDGVGRGAPVANRVFETIWDGGGEDVLDASAYDDGVAIDLTPGAGSVLAADQLAFLNRKDARDAPVYADANVYLAALHEGDARGLIENAVGGAGDDRLSGNGGGNILDGGGGADVIFGDGGADFLLGGAGGDVLRGGGGRDVLTGHGGADELNGGAGRDRLTGGAGRDELTGGRGRDKLVGGGGADDLSGGRGADILIGGAGGDRFHFARGDGADRIMDFDTVRDVIDLSLLETGFDDLAVLDTGQGARIVADGAAILLFGVDADEVSADIFLF